MKLKLLSVPAVALLLILVARGLGANPDAADTAATASHAMPPSTDAPLQAMSPYRDFANVVHSEGIVKIVQARAVTLFQRAQTEGNARGWIDAYCRSVAGDVAYQRQTYGTLTGSAEQFAEFLNRSGELAACSLAQHWIENGGLDAAATVNPDAILQQYQEVYGNAQG